MNLKNIFISFLALGAFTVSAKTYVQFKIDHKLKDAEFGFNKATSNDLNNSLNVTRLQYYVSGISITHDGGVKSLASGVYILADAGVATQVDLGDFENITKIESINFSVGVDPFVNNEDPSQWPSDHPLSPKSPSMHWGWASGYRFVAMEGFAGTGLSNKYEIHAIGNENYFNISLPLDMSVTGDTTQIEIVADYTMALSGIDVSSGMIEHGTDMGAYLLRNFQLKVFKTLDGSGNSVSLKSINLSSTVTAFPNPVNANQSFFVQFENAMNFTVEMYDLCGQKICEWKAVNAKTPLQFQNSGLYILRINAGDINGTTRISIR
ncbi:MAG: T9SS type A sorting domain-containing protein [Bacteroidetes bacterium]|nr:T9SS type A sorting domain-containing protein [Bacteroidota bacterium]